VVGEPAGPLGDLGPGEAAVAEHEALGVGARGSNRLVNLRQRELGRGQGQPGSSSMVTVPALPSTVMVAPSGMMSVASATEATQGTPSSRDTIIA